LERQTRLTNKSRTLEEQFLKSVLDQLISLMRV
jgi:hypothetical protein